MNEQEMGPKLSTGPGEDDWVACRYGGTMTRTERGTCYDGCCDEYDCTCGRTHRVELPE